MAQTRFSFCNQDNGKGSVPGAIVGGLLRPYCASTVALDEDWSISEHRQ